MQELKNELNTLKSQGVSSDQSNPIQDQTPTEIYGEMHDRAIRSKNVIFYNVPESRDENSKNRVEHDKKFVSDLLPTLKVTCSEFKAFRLGKMRQNNVRPLKIVFSDSGLAHICLKNRKLINNLNLQIRADLTVLQRNQLKKAHEELAQRSQVEQDLHIQYIKGIPSKCLLS
uniref:Uncharacterized protein LOC114333187 n=1 Tax=Diabrotica virgifera virgifera TaxID=50390 RepID=A0A6P7G2L9_DIAVI